MCFINLFIFLVKNKIYTYQQNMADEADNIAETTSIADTSITSTISDSNNSQNDSPISRYNSFYFCLSNVYCLKFMYHSNL